MHTAGRIVLAQRQVGAEVIKIDVTGGLGGGVADRLREMGHTVQGVNSSQSAIDRDRFLNARAEMYWTLREAGERGELDLPDDEELIEELGVTDYKPTSGGKVQIESKEAIKLKIGRSPNSADAAAIAFSDVGEAVPDFAYYG